MAGVTHLRGNVCRGLGSRYRKSTYSHPGVQALHGVKLEVWLGRRLSLTELAYLGVVLRTQSWLSGHMFGQNDSVCSRCFGRPITAALSTTHVTARVQRNLTSDRGTPTLMWWELRAPVSLPCSPHGKPYGGPDELVWGKAVATQQGTDYSG